MQNSAMQRGAKTGELNHTTTAAGWSSQSQRLSTARPLTEKPLRRMANCSSLELEPSKFEGSLNNVSDGGVSLSSDDVAANERAVCLRGIKAVRSRMGAVEVQ
ncbi:hypothetical protein NL676_011731 [Syzygium grande]|nr:hypothetical protein NL676_011731 [Syzygium grande]